MLGGYHLKLEAIFTQFQRVSYMRPFSTSLAHHRLILTSPQSRKSPGTATLVKPEGTLNCLLTLPLLSIWHCFFWLCCCEPLAPLVGCIECLLCVRYCAKLFIYITS